MYELEVVRTWERNPQLYADIVGSSLAGQALFAYAPEAERARRVVSKLRQVPRLVQAARDNIKECPGIFVKVGLESWRGVLKFIESDLPRAFSTPRRPAHPRRPGRHLDRSGHGDQRLPRRISRPTWRRAPRPRSASVASGSKQKLKLEEGITLSADRLLAIALRELGEVQEEFRSRRRPANGGDPVEAWRQAKEEHPEPGTLVAGGAGPAQGAARSSSAAGDRLGADARTGGRGAVARVLSLGVCQHVDARPVREQAESRLLLPDRRRSRHGRRSGSRSTCATSTSPTLWNISIHEVYPGHFLHFQHLRQVESKVRKSTLFAPASFVEGWAHYCEQMMMRGRASAVATRR